MSMRILLVEDDPVSRDLLAAVLQARGYDVDQAEDGFGALRFVQDTSYDLVLIDYHLPEMDGYALARLMRTLGEKAQTSLRMAAITADRFGLAARRGADSLFDAMLTKPIDPDQLYAMIDDLLAPADQASCEAIDTFLSQPSSQDAQNAAQVLWRVRGLGELPRAAVFPRPNTSEREALEYCFHLVEPEAADCLVLLSAAGLDALAAVRADAAKYLLPLFALEPASAGFADVLFQVGDGESWSAAAATLMRFRERTAMLRRTVVGATDLPTRIAAYMFVADRSFTMRRDAAGRTSVPYTAGFAPADILNGVKDLAKAGLITAKASNVQPDGMRELIVTLTAKGLASVAPQPMSTLSSAG
jgi:CheY-like chemotaxis protein